MMATPRKNLKTRSNTSSKSSGTQTESPRNESQESTKRSDETSTQSEGTSSSSTPSDDNEALFAEADKASQDAESDDQDDNASESDDDADNASESDSDAPKGNVVSDHGVVATGEVHTFNVDGPLGEYTFKGHVQGNTIIVDDHYYREVSLPGTTKKGSVLAHHKGQTLPLRKFEKFASDLKTQED